MWIKSRRTGLGLRTRTVMLLKDHITHKAIPMKMMGDEDSPSMRELAKRVATHSAQNGKAYQMTR